MLSSGFDSSANERANQMTWPSGTALYIRSMLAVLRTFRPIPYRTVLDGEVVVDDGMIVSLGNGPAFGDFQRLIEYTGGTPWRIATAPSPED